MKVRVQLYGTLRKRFPGYVHARGMEVELPQGGTVEDLMSLLGISESEGAVASIDGRLRKTNEIITFSAHVQVFQSVHGG